MWTAFLDIDADDEDFNYQHVYIEAPMAEAQRIFKAWFGFEPIGISCPRCHLSYAIEEYESLKQALQDNYIFLGEDSVDSYCKRIDVRIFTKDDIGNTPSRPKLLPDHTHECLEEHCRLNALQSRVLALETFLYNVCDNIKQKNLKVEDLLINSQKLLARGDA